MGAPTVSIIIRTRNEEAWIGHCLSAVFAQDFTDFEVIIVDNESTDHTVPMARRHPIKDVVEIHDYLPGKALNMGIEKASGRYIACLSAHCIPSSERWLSTLLSGFEDDTIAGVYGRQLPLPFTTDIDRRDLLMAFGRERRIQTKDYFFHNANSMIRRDVLDRHPFDPTLTNIEDRYWAKGVIEAGYRLIYEPEAAVYHHHGINHGNAVKRAAGTSNILKLIAEDITRDLPAFLRPENSNIVAVVPVLGALRELEGRSPLSDLLEELKAARYVRSIYTLSENPEVAKIAAERGVEHIPRPEFLANPGATLNQVLAYALGEIEKAGVFPEALLSANYLYPFRPPSLFDELIWEFRHEGLDTVFPAYLDYSDHWLVSVEGQAQRVSEALHSESTRPQLFRSLYGLGCVTHSSLVRQGTFVGGKVGVVRVTDHIYTLRCTDHDQPAETPDLATEAGSSEVRLLESYLVNFRP